jgi:hypothetical protein
MACLGIQGQLVMFFKGVFAPLSKLSRRTSPPPPGRNARRGNPNLRNRIEQGFFVLRQFKGYRKTSDVETCVKFCIWRRVVCGTVKVHSTVQAYSTCTPAVLRHPE